MKLNVCQQCGATGYAIAEATSGWVKPDNYRGYFVSKARKRFRELVTEALSQQGARGKESVWLDPVATGTMRPVEVHGTPFCVIS